MEAADLFIFLGKIYVVLIQFRGLLEACQKLPKAETSQSVVEKLITPDYRRISESQGTLTQKRPQKV